jgi:peroxiredoxin family protein
MGRQKKHAILLRSGSLARCAEGLRCAVGLTLVGDQVRVFFTSHALAFLTSEEPTITRPVQTLSRLGHDLYIEGISSPHQEIEPTQQLQALLQECDTSAVW